MHKDWSIDDERQEWLNYAYRKWGIDFVLTLLAENGTMWIERQSEVWSQRINWKNVICNKENWTSNCVREESYWICQLNRIYHPEINWTHWHKFQEWFYDPYKQIDHCWYKYSTGTRFYGYDVRERQRYKIIFD